MVLLCNFLLDTLNTQVHEATKHTPYELVFGQPPRSLLVPDATFKGKINEEDLSEPGQEEEEDNDNLEQDNHRQEGQDDCNQEEQNNHSREEHDSHGQEEQDNHSQEKLGSHNEYKGQEIDDINSQEEQNKHYQEEEDNDSLGQDNHRQEAQDNDNQEEQDKHSREEHDSHGQVEQDNHSQEELDSHSQEKQDSHWPDEQNNHIPETFNGYSSEEQEYFSKTTKESYSKTHGKKILKKPLATMKKHRNVREKADFQYRRNAKRMKHKHSLVHKVKKFVVGQSVSLRIPRIDRTATDVHRLPCVIVQVVGKTQDMYRLRCTSGVLDRCYRADDLEPFAGCYNISENGWENEARTSLREAARSHAPWNAFTGNRCNCHPGTCGTRRCHCKKNGIDCSSHCHKGKHCKNKQRNGSSHVCLPQVKEGTFY